ncbi:CD7 protein, partial [Nothocercus nigrocapillus]|nr:CD7 protein [Nothocercus nigrocapillus]
FLLKTHLKPERVLYVSRQNASTTSTTFANRLEYSKQEKKLVITLHNLQKNDSDIYLCVGVLKNSRALALNGSGTMVLVKEVEQTGCSHSSWIFCGLTVVVVMLFFALICFVLYRVNVSMQSSCQNKQILYSINRSTFNHSQKVVFAN